MTVPVYIAEVSPPHQRGRLVTINSLFITGGQFIACVIDGAFSYLSHDGWRSVFFWGGLYKLFLQKTLKTVVDRVETFQQVLNE